MKKQRRELIQSLVVLFIGQLVSFIQYIGTVCVIPYTIDPIFRKGQSRVRASGRGSTKEERGDN